MKVHTVSTAQVKYFLIVKQSDMNWEILVLVVGLDRLMIFKGSSTITVNSVDSLLGGYRLNSHLSATSQPFYFLPCVW